MLISLEIYRRFLLGNLCTGLIVLFWELFAQSQFYCSDLTLDQKVKCLCWGVVVAVVRRYIWQQRRNNLLVLLFIGFWIVIIIYYISVKYKIMVSLVLSLATPFIFMILNNSYMSSIDRWLRFIYLAQACLITVLCLIIWTFHCNFMLCTSQSKLLTFSPHTGCPHFFFLS